MSEFIREIMLLIGTFTSYSCCLDWFGTIIRQKPVNFRKLSANFLTNYPLHYSLHWAERDVRLCNLFSSPANQPYLPLPSSNHSIRVHTSGPVPFLPSRMLCTKMLRLSSCVLHHSHPYTRKTMCCHQTSYQRPKLHQQLKRLFLTNWFLCHSYSTNNHFTCGMGSQVFAQPIIRCQNRSWFAS